MSKAPEHIAREGGAFPHGDRLVCVPKYVCLGYATVSEACKEGPGVAFVNVQLHPTAGGLGNPQVRTLIHHPSIHPESIY